ncbi:hypothetical protein PWT90_11264 [Aphanocladium album]|nr:hypothetical protein PWT90_11264 [Aphanocladium album]
MSRPVILIVATGPDSSLYLINQEWATLTNDISTRADVDWATSGASVAEKLRYYTPAGILVLDAGWTVDRRERRGMIGHLARYAAQGGGTVVFAGVFPAVVSASAFRAVFPAFGVDWDFVGYENPVRARLNPRATVVAGGAARRHLARELPWMPSLVELSQLTVRLGSLEDVLYAIEETRSRRTGVESGIAMAPVGRGHVAFVGDRENEATTRTIILAMFQLLG